MQLALYLSCALLCSQLALSVHDSPGQSTERKNLHRIVKMVSHTPPASSKGAQVTPGGSRTVDGYGETIEVRTSRTTAKRGLVEYMRPVGSPDDENTFMSAVKRESRGIKRASMTTEEVAAANDKRASDEADRRVKLRASMTTEEVAAANDKRASDEADRRVKMRASMTPEEVAAANAIAASNKADRRVKMRASMTTEEVAADKDRATHQAKLWRGCIGPAAVVAQNEKRRKSRQLQPGRAKIRAQVTANAKNNPDITRQRLEHAAKKQADEDAGRALDRQWDRELLDALQACRIRFGTGGPRDSTKNVKLHKELEKSIYDCLNQIGESIIPADWCEKYRPLMLARADGSVTKFLDDDACALVADGFNFGRPLSTHSGGYIQWPALNQLIFLIAKAVSQATAGHAPGFGRHYFGTNTDFSNGGEPLGCSCV